MFSSSSATPLHSSTLAGSNPASGLAPWEVGGMDRYRAGHSMSASSSGNWGQSSTNELNKSAYQTGYILGSRPDKSQKRFNTEIPTIRTSATINPMIFGDDMNEESLFSSASKSRRRPRLNEEDAPPRESVNDIMHSGPSEYARSRAPQPPATPERGPSSPSKSETRSRPDAYTYVVVFGYPPDQYDLVVNTIRSAGETTEPQKLTTVNNAFKIGYKDKEDALWAISKNGEVVRDSFMIGVKWADGHVPAEVLGVLGSTSQVRDPNTELRPRSPTLPGLRIKPQPKEKTFKTAQEGKLPPMTEDKKEASPTKSIIGQMGDLIFGW